MDSIWLIAGTRAGGCATIGGSCFFLSLAYAIAHVRRVSQPRTVAPRGHCNRTQQLWYAVMSSKRSGFSRVKRSLNQYASVVLIFPTEYPADQKLKKIFGFGQECEG